MARIFNNITGKFEETGRKKTGVSMSLSEAAIMIKGDKGETGAGVAALEFSASGMLRIVMTDGQTHEFQIPSGKDGVGIAGLSQPAPGLLEIALSNGEMQQVNLPVGENGAGISSVTQPDEGVMLVNLSNGRSEKILLPRGRDGQRVEMRSGAGEVEWKYSDESQWKHLMRIPKGRGGGGGAHSLKNLSDVSYGQPLNGQVLTFDAAQNKAKFADAANSGHVIQDEGVALPARSNLNFVGDGVAVSDDAGGDATVVTIAASLKTYLEFFGDGSDGDLTVAGTTTLTRDMYYNNLTINPGGVLKHSGYRIFVKGTLTNNGTIEGKGNNGGNASAPTAGTGGAALSNGTLSGGRAGSNGGAGGTGNGAAGPGGGASIGTLFVAMSGAKGGNGGSGFSGSGGTAAAGGSGSTAVDDRTAHNGLILTTSYPGTVAGSGGGGGGGGDGINASGGGGGGGGSGRTIGIWAKTLKNYGTITAAGGDGGNGATPPLGNCGGGGGGGGGAGGAIYIVCDEYDNSGGVITVAGGAKGIGGSGVGTGVAGQNGVDGPAGVIRLLVLSANILYTTG